MGLFRSFQQKAVYDRMFDRWECEIVFESETAVGYRYIK